MNLRELSSFISGLDNILTESGIDGDQITQIRILDRNLPPDDNVVWMLRPQDHNGYETVYDRLQRWINSQIIISYMNNSLDRDLSIEIMGNGKGMMAI